MTVAKAILLFVAVAVAPILAWMILAMMSDEPPAVATPPASPKEVSVRLFGPADEITGLKVPKGLADQSDTYLRLQEPANVTIRLPGDRTVRLAAKYVSINVDHGTVVDIHLLPLPKALPLREAIAELRRLLREMSIEPDEKMQSQMATWPEDSGHATYSAGMWLSDTVGLGTDVRSADDGGWFLALTFAVRADARRPLWDPTFKAKSRSNVEKGEKSPDRNASNK